MKQFAFIFLCIFATQKNIFSQPVVLSADGPGNTYELINSVLAPGYDVVESPDCIHVSFGRHIAEVWDDVLNAHVFEFYSHVAQDNDRCIVFDRQRVEIKTYDQSPAKLIGTRDETIRYIWRFKIPIGFKPSSNFTHIHQIKPVNGDDGNPIFTLTARKGSPNKLELIHDNTTKVATADLSLFEGEWVEATEIIKVGANGTYSMLIKRLSDNATLIQYSHPNLMTIRPDNDFIRPKWGIYRSLLNPQDLRDDSIRFNAFSIEEIQAALPVKLASFKAIQQANQVSIAWATSTESNNHSFHVERSYDGQLYKALALVQGAGNSATAHQYHWIDDKPIAGINYYRIKQTDVAGQYSFSAIEKVNFHSSSTAGLKIFPNPVSNSIQINWQYPEIIYTAVITNATGKSVLSLVGKGSYLNAAISKLLFHLTNGLYFLNITDRGNVYTLKFIKC